MALDDWPLPDRSGPGAAPLPTRPVLIRLKLTIHPSTGSDHTLNLAAAVAFSGEAWSWLDHALPLVTVNSAPSPKPSAGRSTPRSSAMP